MNETEVLHLDYRPPTAQWVLRLQSRLINSRSTVLRNSYGRWKEVGLGELAGAVATRLTLIDRVIARLHELLQRLRQEIDASGKIDELLSGGYVYSTKDDRIFYDLCVAVDAFFFEYRSCYEIIGKFVKKFGRKMLDRKLTEKEIRAVLEKANLNTEWIDPVRANRILFFHNTAPWIALRIHQRKPLKCSVVVMKKNIENLDDPNTYITEDQLVETIKGLKGAVWAVHAWLEELITELETQTAQACD